MLFLTSFAPALAQDNLFYSQDHDYSLYMRGNGQAVVFARMIVNNTATESMDKFSFEIPGAEPSNLAIYQQILEANCRRYNDNGSCQTYYTIDYGYSRYYESYYNPTYHAIDYELEDGVVSFDIPAPIDPEDTNAFIVSYTAFDYVDKSLGLYKYNFESFVVDSRINEVSVAIDAEADYYLKGKQSEVSYATYGFEDSPAAYGGLGEVAGMSDTASLSKAVGSIGNTGEVIKETRLLEAGETYNVNGKYASTWFRLHLLTFGILVLVLIAFIIGLFFLHKASVRKSKAAPVDQVSPQPQSVVFRYINALNIILGLFSAGLVVGASHFIRWFVDSDLFRDLIRSQEVLAPILGIMMVIFYLLAILGPAIIGSSKKGWRTFLTIMLMQFVWFVIYVVLHLIFSLS